jgi:hypothetical protein
MLHPSDLTVFASLVDARLVEIQANKSALQIQPTITDSEKELLHSYYVFEKLYVGIKERINAQTKLQKVAGGGPYHLFKQTEA